MKEGEGIRMHGPPFSTQILAACDMVRPILARSTQGNYELIASRRRRNRPAISMPVPKRIRLAGSGVGASVAPCRRAVPEPVKVGKNPVPPRVERFSVSWDMPDPFAYGSPAPASTPPAAPLAIVTSATSAVFVSPELFT